MVARRTCAALAACVVATGCQEAEPRPQVELFVDVDMPVPAQIGDTVSSDAVVDTLRVEVLDAERNLLDSRILSLTSPEALPLSLGIPSDVASGKVLVRVRAFRAFFTQPGQQADDPVLDPFPEVTVDRLIEIELPAEGVVTKSVTLHGDCMGLGARFAVGSQPNRTCIDAEHTDGLATDGIEDAAGNASTAGTWARAAVVPCSTEPPAGARCIPGGFTILGDPQFIAANEYDIDAFPLKPVTLSPFFLDETEVTVGMLRDLEDAGYDGELPYPTEPEDPEKRYCTWSDTYDDDVPVNCIAVEVADDVCAERGGTVPTEAQWEYAARGRGDRLLYTWGNEGLACCNTSIGRIPGGGCEIGTIEPIKSHTGDDECDGDVTRDGVIDMGGSVSELVRDSVALFDEPCWEGDELAILQDPVCIGAVARIGRGAAWGLAFGDAPLPIRRSYLENSQNYGFRCAYEDTR